MNTAYDDLEIRSPDQREAALMAALPVQVASAQTRSPALADILHGVDAAAITSRAALAHLPVIRKHELLERQLAARQAGGGGNMYLAALAALVLAPTCRVCLPARGPFMSPRALFAITGAWRVPFMPQAFAPVS